MADTAIFDFDNHYYESEDAFTRHADPALRNRGVRWADIDGRRRLLVGGTINSYVANPRFDPVARKCATGRYLKRQRNTRPYPRTPGRLVEGSQARDFSREPASEQGLAGVIIAWHPPGAAGASHGANDASRCRHKQVPGARAEPGSVDRAIAAFAV